MNAREKILSELTGSTEVTEEGRRLIARLRYDSPEIKRLAAMTWKCEITYGDIFAVGNNQLRDKIWRAENIIHNAKGRAAKKVFKSTGKMSLGLEKRLGVEMAWESDQQHINKFSRST